MRSNASFHSSAFSELTVFYPIKQWWKWEMEGGGGLTYFFHLKVYPTNFMPFFCMAYNIQYSMK